jgi:hypothetical protein
MDDQQDQLVIEGEPPSEMDVYFKQFGMELHKGNLTFLRDTLHKFAVLNSGIIGGSIFIFKDDSIINPSLRAFVVASFVCSLLSCLIGMMPIPLPTELLCPDNTRTNIESTTKMKTKCLRVAALFIGLGFSLVLLAIGITALKS